MFPEHPVPPKRRARVNPVPEKSGRALIWRVGALGFGPTNAIPATINASAAAIHPREITGHR